MECFKKEYQALEIHVWEVREKEQSRMTPTQVAGLENWKISWEVIKTVWKYLPHCTLHENTKQSSLSSASQTALGDLKS